MDDCFEVMHAEVRSVRFASHSLLSPFRTGVINEQNARQIACRKHTRHGRDGDYKNGVNAHVIVTYMLLQLPCSGESWQRLGVIMQPLATQNVLDPRAP